MSNATRERKRPDGKPYPYDGFPLTAHPSGRWCKKVRINGKWGIRYFGRWFKKIKTDDGWKIEYLGDDAAKEALELYEAQQGDIFLGREPSGNVETVRDLLNAYLASKRTRVETDELAESTWDDYKATCDEIADCFGKSRPLTSLRTADFDKLREHLQKGKKNKKTGKRRSLTAPSLKGELTQARMVFGYAQDNGVLLPYKRALASPSRKAIRVQREESGERMFEAAEIRDLLKAADPQLRAMIYLGINCAFGPTDCGRLTFDKVKAGWQSMGRKKTGTPRRCPLWPETQKAIDAYLQVRPEPKPGNERLVFLTRFGNSWARERTADNGISSEFAKLLDTLKMHRNGHAFYSLRRTFETVGSHCGPQFAVDRIMGHAPKSDDMAATYRQRVADSVLMKVAKYVRQWLKGAVMLD
jgi:integrase